MKSTCINSITKIIASVLIVFVIINNPVFSQIKENYVIEWVYHGFNGAQLQATIQPAPADGELRHQPHGQRRGAALRLRRDRVRGLAAEG